MTAIQHLTETTSEPQSGDVIDLPAFIGHTRPTGYSTVFPRGEFDRELRRDCEADGAALYLRKAVA